METIFIKHEIKSVNDLPEMYGPIYFVISKDGDLEVSESDYRDGEYWLANFAFWLEEKEISALKAEQEPLSAEEVLIKIQDEYIKFLDRCIKCFDVLRNDHDFKKGKKFRKEILAWRQLQEYHNQFKSDISQLEKEAEAGNIPLAHTTLRIVK